MKHIFLIIVVLAGLNGFAQPAPELEEIKEAQEETPEAEVATNVSQQNYKSSLIAAFENGNASKLAAFFSENIDLSILDKQNLYSKSQAEQILKTFFENNPPTSFTVEHDGKSGQSDFLIGKLVSSNGKFRVTVNSKSTKSAKKITSLSIEKDESE